MPSDHEVTNKAVWGKMSLDHQRRHGEPFLRLSIRSNTSTPKHTRFLLLTNGVLLVSPHALTCWAKGRPSTRGGRSWKLPLCRFLTMLVYGECFVAAKGRREAREKVVHYAADVFVWRCLSAAEEKNKTKSVIYI